MFGFLKKKLKDAVSKFSKRVDDEVEDKAEEKAEEKAIPKAAPKSLPRTEEKVLPKTPIKIQEKPAEKISKKPEAVPEAKKPEYEFEEELPEEAEQAEPEKSEEIFAEESRLKEEIKEKIEKIEEQKEKVAEGIRKIGEVDDSEPEKKEELIEEVQEEIEEIKEEVKEVEEKRGFLSRIFGRKEPEKEKEEEKSQTESVTESKTLGLSKPRALRGNSQTTFVKKEVREEKAEIPEKVIQKTEKPQQKKTPIEKVEEKEELHEGIKEEAEEEKEEVEEKKGFFQRIAQKITTKTISEDKFDDLFWELEMAMLENNVAVEVIDKIKSDLKKNIVGKPIQRSKVDETIVYSLRESIEDLFDVPQIDLIKKIKDKKDKPFVVVFVGVNGSGKTTTIAKFAKMLQDHKFSVVLGAADTFRAAAIDQLQLHANNLGIKMIRHDYGSDPAAVAFDAIKHAQASSKDAVLIDTAGRLHSNTNLMDEMKKIIRVAKPDLTIFIGESITGNDCVEQAKMFDQAAGFDAIVLSKADVDEKGGAAISISYITKKPIIYIGVGQEYGDLKKFDSKLIVESLGLA